MSQGLKIFLIICGVCVVGFIAMIVAGVVWFNANKDELATDFKAKVEEIHAEASTFAQATDQQGCLDEAVRRASACGGFSPMCEAHAGIFGRICLDEARPTAGLCNGVPKPDAIMDTVTWAAEVCTKYEGVPMDRCQRIYQPLQKFCHESGG